MVGFYDSFVLALILALLSAFVPDERLEYDLRYGPFKLGDLALVTLVPDTIQGESCYHFRAELESNPSFGFLFKAKYELETWCRIRDMVTMRSYKRTRESRYRCEWVANYDYNTDRVLYSDSTIYPLPDSARDLLTLWYYFRKVHIDLGDTITVDSHIDRHNYLVRVIGTRLTKVQTMAGKFDCLEVVPSAGTPFGTVYFSKETNRVPVVIRTHVGSMLVSAFLRSVKFQEVE
ncbi:hypothetical protein CH330_09435 [candidate division WOR-3 bacterium JGI_Cruoil_03_51_56]|uniref:DUF3108 domain-containing protein n=1 Tax=candidate division WOR-3 bacterium JGI_Cruoil_03_51_56 TaxID=1973747 RepID=A0A235BPD5_UNCW3|nr:MAG: hypothetical protein CH330_09435 [candidate division WOR-3 bacterium JGI_Cruoil_03_51_56]